MSMGHAGAYADVIEEEKLAALFPKQFQALKETVEQSPIILTMNHLAGQVQAGNGADGIRDDVVRDALYALLEAFSRRFEGLSLNLGYHDSDNDGDCYDQVSGAYWAIEGLHVLSEGAKRLGEQNFERKFFVVYG